MKKPRTGKGLFFTLFAIMPKSREGWQMLFRRAKLWKQMLGAFFRREADFPWGTVSGIGLALLYVVFPLDLIPDLFLGLGWLDDFFIVAQCLKLIKRDLVKYAVRHNIDQEPYGL